MDVVITIGARTDKKLTRQEHVIPDVVERRAFGAFQARFLVVQLVATFVDFIQGPYLYKVYDTYGYSMVRGEGSLGSCVASAGG
jgi:hypothetical protein